MYSLFVSCHWNNQSREEGPPLSPGPRRALHIKGAQQPGVSKCLSRKSSGRGLRGLPHQALGKGCLGFPGKAIQVTSTSESLLRTEASPGQVGGRGRRVEVGEWRLMVGALWGALLRPAMLGMVACKSQSQNWLQRLLSPF